jgi:hypothetical protein
MTLLAAKVDVKSPPMITRVREMRTLYWVFTDILAAALWQFSGTSKQGRGSSVYPHLV